MVSLGKAVEEDKPSVLVVDDLRSNLELFEAIFVDAGFRVFSALDASSAINIFESRKIDIAILDVMMPGMDGYELCKRIKELSGKRFFPVILLTALTDRQSKITGLECGADDFIVKPFDSIELITKARSLVKLKTFQNELEHSENVILTLVVAMEAREPYTREHSTRVSDISMSFASFLGLARREQEQIRKAGILHDIGKIGVSTGVLCKRGNLNDEEFEEIKRHTIIGEEICRPLISMQDALPSIRSHHERWDGRGFPDGVSGENIPLNSRILSIADSFDAMVTERPYRERISVGTALGVFEKERDYGQWDPELVGHFIAMMNQLGSEKIEKWLNL